MKGRKAGMLLTVLLLAALLLSGCRFAVVESDTVVVGAPVVTKAPDGQ